LENLVPAEDDHLTELGNVSFLFWEKRILWKRSRRSHVEHLLLEEEDFSDPRK